MCRWERTQKWANPRDCSQGSQNSLLPGPTDDRQRQREISASQKGHHHYTKPSWPSVSVKDIEVKCQTKNDCEVLDKIIWTISSNKIGIQGALMCSHNDIWEDLWQNCCISKILKCSCMLIIGDFLGSHNIKLIMYVSERRRGSERKRKRKCFPACTKGVSWVISFPYHQETLWRGNCPLSSAMVLTWAQDGTERHLVH